MPGDPRVQDLIEEILESGRGAEDVCRACPELLPEVREGWRRFRAVEAQVGALFPGPGSTDDHGATAPEIGPPQISGYEILGVLGRGGVGVVYKAVHLRLNRAVALKMLLAGAVATRAERHRFSRESEVVASLRHPNIVQVYDTGDLDGRPYFTMEFVEGGSLAEKIAGTPRPARQAAELVATLADAMEEAHRGGVVHRDLKPSNILLTADGTPKIGDFGLARHLEVGPSLTQSGAALGTPSYMAPEQARGKSGEAGPLADLYALGAVLYELLTGRPPFRAESAAETLHQVMTRDPVPPSRLNAKVPRDLETICLKCLRKEPQSRYLGAAALAEDLRRFLGGETIAARPENLPRRLVRRVRRRPILSTTIAVAALLAVTMVVGGLRLIADRAATERAVDEDLREMVRWQEKSAWPEAGASLERAKGRLDDRGSTGLRRRLEQGARDLDLVANLEQIRLRLSNSRVPLSPEKMYAEAFRNYGIDPMRLEPAAAATTIRNSAVRDTLLEFLHDWLYWVSDEDRAKLQTAVDGADDDEWRRAYRRAIAVKDRDPVKLMALAAAPEAATQPPVILSGLCGSLLIHNKRAEAQAVLVDAQRRHPGDFWINYLLGHFWDEERPHLAVGYFRAAVAIRPTSDQAYAMLARALRETGDADGAIDAFRKAIALNSNAVLVKDLAKLLAPRGGLEEARVAWEKLLEGKPSDHQSWYGYAQLCLFLGNDRGYLSARKALLDRFESGAVDWFVAERTSLACLLRPAVGDELPRMVAMVDRAVAVGPKSPHPDHAYVQFVKGLAEYRQGRSVQAIPLLRESAAILSNRPGPRLVLAMAQFQSGYKMEARNSLELALGNYNWKELQVDQPTIWVSHVLRREAERLILPDFPGFLNGKHQAQDEVPGARTRLCCGDLLRPRLTSRPTRTRPPANDLLASREARGEARGWADREEPLPCRGPGCSRGSSAGTARPGPSMSGGDRKAGPSRRRWRPTPEARPRLIPPASPTTARGACGVRPHGGPRPPRIAPGPSSTPREGRGVCRPARALRARHRPWRRPPGRPRSCQPGRNRRITPVDLVPFVTNARGLEVDHAVGLPHLSADLPGEQERDGRVVPGADPDEQPAA